ncbi:DUF4248 domain-containing protein [Porphyromonas sp.]|nr:DUF4248 domain-containing protein [Porphyromonas sp.]MDO4770422.1 DUF4248 domain-containing protein [Porphyromonas sp.]
MRDNPGRHRSLIESGWNSRKRTFTPRQVQILRKFLGDPM